MNKTFLNRKKNSVDFFWGEGVCMANKPRRGYATFSADTKRALVSSWRAVKSLGVKKKAFLSGLAEEGLSVNKNTFNDWLRDFDANGAIGTPTVGSGRPVALS